MRLGWASTLFLQEHFIGGGVSVLWQPTEDT